MRHVLVIMLFFTGVTAAVAQVNISPNGIRSSKLNIELPEETRSLAMLDSSVGQYRLYFTGENHQFRVSNYKLELKLIQYLHKTAGVNHLLLEFGQSIGYLVNHYIQTGDTATKKILNHYFFPEYVLLFEGVKQYNEKLDSADRLMIHGIDLERAPEITIKVLTEFLPDTLTNLPDSIAMSVEAMIGLASYYDNQKTGTEAGSKSKSKPYYSWNNQNYSLNKSVKLILANYKANKSDFESVVTKDFHVFDSIMKDLEKSYEWGDLSYDRTIQQAIFREKFLYNRFTKLYEFYPDGSFFGQFGRCHIMTDENDPNCAYEAFRSLAKRINENTASPLNNKVLPLPIYYLNTNYRYSDVHITEKLVKELKLKDYEGVTLIEIVRDSTYFKDFPKGFSHILVNTFPADETSRIISSDSGEITENYSKEYNSFDFLGHYGQFANDNFKSFLQTYQSGFSDYFGFGIASTSYGKGQPFASVRLLFYDTPSLQSGDSLAYKLTGFESTIWIGYSPLAGRAGAFSLFGGFGYTGWRLRETITRETSPVISDTYFHEGASTEQRTNIYRNPAFVLDLGTDIRIRMGFMYLTFSGVYRFDMSSEQWKLKGKRLESSPGKNNGGLIFQAGIGISID